MCVFLFIWMLYIEFWGFHSWTGHCCIEIIRFCTIILCPANLLKMLIAQQVWWILYFCLHKVLSSWNRDVCTYSPIWVPLFLKLIAMNRTLILILTSSSKDMNHFLLLPDLHVKPVISLTSRRSVFITDVCWVGSYFSFHFC